MINSISKVLEELEIQSTLEKSKKDDIPQYGVQKLFQSNQEKLLQLNKIQVKLEERKRTFRKQELQIQLS